MRIKLWLIITLTSMLLVSCRKKELREELKEVEMASSCSNGVLDNDEIGIDCGGVECKDCVQNELPCELSLNKARLFYNGSLSTRSILSTEIIKNLDGSWVFKAYVDPENLYYLSFNFLSKPDITTVYKGVDTEFEQKNNEVYIRFYAPGDDKDLAGLGDVYIRYELGKYILSSCAYVFEYIDETFEFGIEEWFNVVFE